MYSYFPSHSINWIKIYSNELVDANSLCRCTANIEHYAEQILVKRYDMRILVYGAGVLGCHLAHALLSGGNDVTLLARGEWKNTINRDGLIIRHWAQLKTTADYIKTIDRLDAEDVFDIIFVVMQYTQVPSVLPDLAANKSGVVVFVGNNMNAIETESALAGGHPKKKVFGFQSTAGRRESGRVVCIRLGGRMTLGSLDADTSAYPLIEKAFRNCSYKLIFSDNMDAWLKCHVAFVVPISFVVYACGGNLKKADRALLNRAIDASSEAYAALEALNIPILPEGSEEFVRSGRKSVIECCASWHRRRSAAWRPATTPCRQQVKCARSATHFTGLLNKAA